MKTILRLLCVFFVAMLVFLPIHPVSAAGSTQGGQVIFGQSFTLKSGDTMNGDLLVFGGSASIEKGATVNGSVVLFGGSLSLGGTVNGDVAITGGAVSLKSASHITGNLTTIAASLNRTNGSKVDGQIFNTATSWVGTQPGKSTTPGGSTSPITPLPNSFRLNFNPFLSIVNAIAQSLGLAILAMLLMLFLANHADRVAHAIIAQPLDAGGIGLLTVVVLPIALVLCVVTLILIPVVPIILVAVAAAVLFGWIAIGYEVGQRFTTAIHQTWHPVLSAGLGTFAISLVARLLIAIPILNCIGWLVPFLLTLAGLGAVITTRFGTQLVEAPVKPVAVAPMKPAPATPMKPAPATPTKPAEAAPTKPGKST